MSALPLTGMAKTFGRLVGALQMVLVLLQAPVLNLLDVIRAVVHLVASLMQVGVPTSVLLLPTDVIEMWKVRSSCGHCWGSHIARLLSVTAEYMIDGAAVELAIGRYLVVVGQQTEMLIAKRAIIMPLVTACLYQ
jgi:hypothetical protein